MAKDPKETLKLAIALLRAQSKKKRKEEEEDDEEEEEDS